MPARKPAALDTTAQVEVEGIDLEAWMENAEPIVDSVQITIKRHLVPKIDALNEQIEAAKKAAPVERGLGDPAPPDAAEEYKALVSEYLESFKTFTFRARVPGDNEAIADAMKADKAPSNLAELNFYRTAHYSVEPRMTGPQVRRLAEKIGSTQYESMMMCWANLQVENPEYDVPK